MRVVPFVVSACVCAGCDGVWDLEHIDNIECVESGHDEDGDGIDDYCDACPFAAEHGADDDRDGIALPCDPDPTTPNELLQFSGFDPLTRTTFTATDGGFTADTYHVMGTGSAQLIATLHDPASIWVIAGVDVNRREGAGYSEIGFVFDAIPTSVSTQVNGYLCVLGYGLGENYVETYKRDRPNGDSGTNHSMTSLDIATFSGTMRASYQRTETPAASCSFIGADGAEVAIGGTPTMPQPPGKLALFAQDVDAEFRFLFVTTK